MASRAWPEIRRAALAALAVALAGAAQLPASAAAEPAKKMPATAPTTAEVLAASEPSDWRRLDPQSTLYLELPGGRVIIELAPAFAPNHVANVAALAREGFFDGLDIVRAQDNYVVQWGDPEGKKPLQKAQRTLPA